MEILFTQADYDRLNKGKETSTPTKPAGQSSNNNTYAENGKVKSSTVKEWDKNFQPIVEDLKLQDKFNYGSSKHIMRAVNGRYDGVMKQLKTEDPAMYKIFDQFTNASKAFGQGLVTYKKTGNPDAINKYYKEATNLYDEIAEKFDYGNNKKWAVDANAQILTRKEYEKQNQDAHVSKKSSNSGRVVFDGDELIAEYEKRGISPEYNKLVNQKNIWQSEIKKKAVPIINAWVNNTLQNIDATDATKADSNNNAWHLNVDLLKHVSQHGTVSNADLKESDKKLAMSIRKQMWNKDLAGQLNALKTNKAAIEGMSRRLGFYGSSKLLTTYKNTVGSDVKFYPNTNKKTNSEYANDDMDSIEVMLNHYAEFKEIDSNFRNSAVKLSKNNWKTVVDESSLDMNKKQFDIVMDAMVDEKGNISTYDKWKKSLQSVTDPSGNNAYFLDPNEMTMQHEIKRDAKGKPVKQNVLGQLWEQNKTGNWNDPLQYFTGQTNREGVEEDLKALYNNVKKSYKLQFSNLKASHDYDNTMLLNGFGDNYNQVIGHVGIDLTVDKNLNLNSTTSKKQENANKIISLLKDQNGSFEDTGVTVFGESDIKEGLHAIQADELEGYQAQNEEKAKKFFKGDMSHVNMEFYRNTNIQGQVAYAFTNTNTKEQMVMFVPVDKVNKNGAAEDFYVNTTKSPLDFNFQAKGFKDMAVYSKNNKPAYKKAQLTYDAEHNNYLGKMTYFDDKGNLQDFTWEIPYASAQTVKEATKTFDIILRNYSKK